MSVRAGSPGGPIALARDRVTATWKATVAQILWYRQGLIRGGYNSQTTARLTGELIVDKADAVKDDIGTAVLFENDQVKIWDMQLQPGEAQGLHRHTNDYVLVFIGDCRLRGVNADGTTRFEQDMPDGTTILRDLAGSDDVHDAVNVGDGPSRNIIIELKKPA